MAFISAADGFIIFTRAFEGAAEAPRVSMNLTRIAVSSLALTLAMLGVGSFSVRAAGQQTAGPEPPGLQYEVAVTLKLIQVYVTDKKGNPVPDLTMDDFAVFDDGRRMTLSEFERHAVAPLGPLPAPAAGLAPGSGKSPPPLTRKFFLFFDFTFNNQRGIVKSKEAALHFLDTEVRPDDEVALVSSSMVRGLRFHEYLTTDHRKIREALAAVDGRRISGRAQDIEEEYWMHVGEALAILGDAWSVFLGKPPHFDWQRQESKAVVLSYLCRLTDLAKALRLIKGEKHFLYFSSGIPTSMIYGNQVGNPNFPLQASKFDAGDYVLRSANENLLKELAASNCVVYAFDTRESAKVPSLFAYDDITMSTGIRDIFSDMGVFQSTNSVFRDERTTGLDALKRMSDVTGGKYYSNINMYERNLSQVQARTGAYYVLGYSISAPWDGRYHEVRVEVKRKGCEVRAQTGYFDPKPFREYSDLEKELHLFDLALNERSDLRTPSSVPLSALIYEAGAAGRVELVSRLPAHVLPGSLKRAVEFVLLGFDDQDNLADLQRARFDLTRCQQSELVFSAGAALAPGDYRFRLVVRDLETGASALGSTAFHIAGRAASGLVLHSPLLLAPGGPTAYLEIASPGEAGPPAWREIYAFDRGRYRPVVGPVAGDTPVALAVVPYSVAGLVEPAVELSAYLIDAASGERQPVSFYLQSRTRLGTSEAQILEFSPAGVRPGTYRLYIHAEDTDSRARSHTQMKLVVR
jgi:VWFA-related protein